MIIDGEKYACEACVRGHRVSNCQHSDRPLQHINKKGRPVSQCAHCRAMRKSRSAHVKCDCGIKPNKCIHLQPRVNGHTNTCCCNHGGTCTCACSSDGSASVAGEVGVGCKNAPRARRATTAHSPPRSVLAKHAQQHKSALRSRSSTTHSRVAPLTITRRRSASSLHGLAASHQDTASGDTTPEHVTESGSPPPGDAPGTMPGPVAPLDLSRSATFPPSYVQNVGYDLVGLGGGGGFSESEGPGPLYSAGLATPPSMWAGGGELFMPPGYGGLPRSSGNHMFDFDFAMAPDAYSEQSSDPLPNLAAASSGEVSEADDHHSPHGLEAVDFLQDHPDYDGGMVPHPEIFDDTPLYYTFDDEFQVLGYSEGGYAAEKAPEYGYWPPSPERL